MNIIKCYEDVWWEKKIELRANAALFADGGGFNFIPMTQSSIQDDSSFSTYKYTFISHSVSRRLFYLMLHYLSILLLVRCTHLSFFQRRSHPCFDDYKNLKNVSTNVDGKKNPPRELTRPATLALCGHLIYYEIFETLPGIAQSLALLIPALPRTILISNCPANSLINLITLLIIAIGITQYL